MKKYLIAVLALFLIVPFLATPSHAAENPKVKAAMTALKDVTAALGKPKLDGENLMFGTTKVNGNYTVVDAIKTKHEGTATLFGKKGDNFVRVSTNVMKDGQRAVGSALDPSGPAYAAVKKGEAYYGIVDILGKMYDTGYEPIKAEDGAIIGVYYVGFLIE